MRLRKRPGLRSGPRAQARAQTTRKAPSPRPITPCKSPEPLPPPEPVKPVPLIDEEDEFVIVMDDDDAGLIDLRV